MWLIKLVFISGFLGIKRLAFYSPWTGCQSIAGYSSALTGTHLLSWVERSNYDKVPHSRLQVSRLTWAQFHCSAYRKHRIGAYLLTEAGNSVLTASLFHG